MLINGRKAIDLLISPPHLAISLLCMYLNCFVCRDLLYLIGGVTSLYNPVCLSLGVGRSVRHNFPNWWEVKLPCCYWGTCLIHFKTWQFMNDWMDFNFVNFFRAQAAKFDFLSLLPSLYISLFALRVFIHLWNFGIFFNLVTFKVNL